MSVSPVSLNPVGPGTQHRVRNAWLSVFFSLIFVCCTSTNYMSGARTQVLVNSVWLSLLGKWHFDLTGFVNFMLRKIGHFFGYGTIGLIFHRAWYHTSRLIAWIGRGWRIPFATSFAVASTFFVASMDEWHQKHLRGRVGSFHDVLLDTAGAFFFNTLLWAARARNNRKLLGQRGLECGA